MKQLKIKITYSELQALDYMLVSGNVKTNLANNYANKAVVTLLLDFTIKRIKPLTYIAFDKPKSFSIPVPVACALVHFYQHAHVTDAYHQHVLRTIINNLEPHIAG